MMKVEHANGRWHLVAETGLCPHHASDDSGERCVVGERCQALFTESWVLAKLHQLGPTPFMLIYHIREI